jgi:hypothetical protein
MKFYIEQQAISDMIRISFISIVRAQVDDFDYRIPWETGISPYGLWQ